MNPWILVPLANSRNTFRTTISNWNGMQQYINFYIILHTGYFLELLNKNYLRKNPNCRYQQVKNMKIKGPLVISILKINETIVPIFFLIFSGWYLKLRFALNSFWDKNLKNRQLCLIKSLTCNYYFISSHFELEMLFIVNLN